MKKIMFVCHGNICRSPMAEFLFKEIVKENGLENGFIIQSSATSSEELNNPVHRGTAKILDRLGIDYSKKRATKLLQSDFYNFDYFVCMDQRNIGNMQRIFYNIPQEEQNKKIFKLTDFAPLGRDIADPYWTGDFQQTFNDITYCLKGFWKFLIENEWKN